MRGLVIALVAVAAISVSCMKNQHVEVEEPYVTPAPTPTPTVEPTYIDSFPSSLIGEHKVNHHTSSHNGASGVYNSLFYVRENQQKWVSGRWVQSGVLTSYNTGEENMDTWTIDNPQWDVKNEVFKFEITYISNGVEGPFWSWCRWTGNRHEGVECSYRPYSKSMFVVTLRTNTNGSNFYFYISWD